MSSQSSAVTDRFTSFDGVELAYTRIGQGRAVVLLHGLFSSADMNWFRFGHAQALADAGFEAIALDLRVHGNSAAPHDPAAYPHDVLVKDVEALISHLGLDDFDLVGFSLGARTAARCVLAGMAPRRLVLAGMGLEGLAGWHNRSAFFIDAIDRAEEVRQGDPAYMAVQFMKTMKIDRVAARLLLQSIGDTNAAELNGIMMPTLVLCGSEDRDNGSPASLIAALPHASFAEVPGTHMSSVTKPELGQALVRYLVD